MAKATRKTTFHSGALQYTYDRFIAGHPERESAYEQALFDTEVASKVYDLRTKAGLSQGALAKKVGTTAFVICRLEEADYEGNSLACCAASRRRSASVFRFGLFPSRSRRGPGPAR